MKKGIFILLVTAMVCATANAVRFDLYTATASYDDGNPKADGLFEWDSGSITVNPEGYTFSQGGSNNPVIAGNPPWFEIDFEGNPQPFLTKVVYKAGSGGYVWSGLALNAFNSGVWTSLRVHGDGSELLNNPGNAYKALSHGGVDGRPGISVPDTGATLALLGLGLATLGIIRRRTR